MNYRILFFTVLLWKKQKQKKQCWESTCERSLSQKINPMIFELLDRDWTPPPPPPNNLGNGVEGWWKLKGFVFERGETKVCRKGPFWTCTLRMGRQEPYKTIQKNQKQNIMEWVRGWCMSQPCSNCCYHLDDTWCVFLGQVVNNRILVQVGVQ